MHTLGCGNVSVFGENTVCGISLRLRQMWPRTSRVLFHHQRLLCVCQKTSTEFSFWGWNVMSRKRYKWLKNDLLTSTVVAVMNRENKREIKKKKKKKRIWSASGKESRSDWVTRGSERRENRVVWWMFEDMGFCQWVMRWNGARRSLLDYFCWSFLVLSADWWFI